MILKAQNLSKIYTFKPHFYCKKQEFCLFKAVNFILHLGENLLIQGASGSGKSTLAKMLCMIEKPSSGALFLDEVSLFTLSQKEQRLKRKYIQYVFSDAKLCLNPYKKIESLLKFVFHNFNQSYDEKLVNEFFAQFHLSKELLHYKVAALSGGEAVRLNLIRALLVKAPFLILDECFASLDKILAQDILKYLAHLQKKQKCSFIFISHQDELLRDFELKLIKL